VVAYLRRCAVVPDHGEPLGIDVARDEHLAATRQARRHPDGVSGGAAPAVDRQADEVHRHELAQLAGVLEPGLVAPVVRGGRAPDRRQELAARDDLVADGRDVVLPAAGAEEAEVVGTRAVPRQHLGEVAAQLRFGADRRRELQRPREAMGFRNLLEQLVDAVQAGLLEHRRDDARRGDRHVGMSIA